MFHLRCTKKLADRMKRALDPDATPVSDASRLGDWFAGACVLLATLLWLSGIFERWILAIQHRIAAFVRRRRTA